MLSPANGYDRPETLADAISASADRAVTFAAGCTDLYPATGFQTFPGPVVDLTGLAELRGVGRSGSGWRIGAAATWSDIIRADLPPAFDGLKAAARQIGGVQIQNAGTIGGNLCNASPAADGVPPLLTLDAEVELASRAGLRRMPLAAFLTGSRRTALAPGEVMAAVIVADASGLGSGGFRKLGARAHLVISIAMVAVRIVMREGHVASAALSVGACGPVAVRLPVQEAALVGLSADRAADSVTADLVGPALSPIADVRADADYRVTAATELLARAVAGAAGAAR